MRTLYPVGAEVSAGPDSDIMARIESVTINRHGTVEYELSVWREGQKFHMPLPEDDIREVLEMFGNEIMVEISEKDLF